MSTEFSIRQPLEPGTTVIEASAGTGKTWVLTSLVVRAVAEGTPIGRILVMTFGRAATTQVRARVRDRLGEAAQFLARVPDSPDTDELHAWLADAAPDVVRTRAERIRAASDQIDTALVATTHEFCERALRLADLAGGSPAATSLRPDAEPLIRDVAHDLSLGDDRTVTNLTPALDVALQVAREVTAHPGHTIASVDGDGAPAQRRGFALAVRREVERRKRQRGWRTFDDIVADLHRVLDAPETGPMAGQRLRVLWDLVLVDEFQDTDPQQWGILKTLFADRVPLVLIGDPKQAIYAFRGADVHTYLRAREEADRTLTLQSNHRSDPALVTAVGSLLGAARLGDDRIRVRPVAAAIPPEEAALSAAPPGWQPVRIRIPSTTEPVAVGEARRIIADDLVNVVRSTLDSGLRIRDNHAAPRHIAVLVNTNNRGRELRRALADAGVPAVFPGAGDLFDTDAATELRRLITGLHSSNPQDWNLALMTSPMGLTLADLVGEHPDVQALAQRREAWTDALTRGGPVALLEAVDAVRGSGALLAGREGGAERWEEFRLVAEEATTAMLGHRWTVAELLAWWEERRGHTPDSATRAAVASGTDDAVTLMTVHRSKGLQFPLVMLPDAGIRGWQPEPSVLAFHHPRHGLTLDVSGSGSPWREHLRLAGAEADGEDLRKLYVALTRARCGVVTWWVPTKKSLASSALHRLLGADPGTGEVPRSVPVDEDIPHAARLRCADGIGVESIPAASPAPIGETLTPAAGLDLPPPLTQRPSIDRCWRRTSYSGLTRLATHDVPETVIDDEPPLDDPSPAAEEEVGIGCLFGDDVGGVVFGSLVHGCYEELDTSVSDLAAECRRVATEQLRLWPVPGVAPERLAADLHVSLHTPLGRLAPGRTLGSIRPEDRLPEMDFELPLGGSRPAALGDLAELMAAHLPANDPLAEYPDRLLAAVQTDGSPLADQLLHGFLTGSIDAVLRLEGPRHLVVDYKTNRLSPPGRASDVGHYTHPAMAQAMMASHYALQALLYSVALHRFLRWRLSGYCPAEHLGGVLYLFVRAMTGPHTTLAGDDPPGVFSWHPPSDLVVEASQLLAGR